MPLSLSLFCYFQLSLYDRYLQSSQSFLLACFIELYLDMRHLLPEFPHQWVHMNMFETGICQVLVQLRYLVKRALPYNPGSQIPFHISRTLSIQNHLDAIHCLKGSALGEGMDWMIRKIPSIVED